MESGTVRGSSAPAAGRPKAKANPNPFWDERHQDEFRLQLARPADLPAPEEGAREVTQTAGSQPTRPPQGVAGSSAGGMAPSSSSVAIPLPDRSGQEGNGGESQLGLRHAQAPPRELAPEGKGQSQRGRQGFPRRWIWLPPRGPLTLDGPEWREEKCPHLWIRQQPGQEGRHQ